MVLTGLKYVGPVNTKHGTAQKVFVTVVTRESYGRTTDRQVTYSALGVGFAAMAQRATQADFPHVAEFIRAPLPGGREVKRFARVDIDPGDWIKGDDGPPLPPEAMGTGVDTPGEAPSPSDDIGF